MPLNESPGEGLKITRSGGGEGHILLWRKIGHLGSTPLKVNEVINAKFSHF